MAAAINLVRSFFDIAEGAEITIEANPDDVSPEVARAWRDAGVNRVSLGAQSFNDDLLGWMHRTHDSARIGYAVKALRRAEINNFSIDLIFARPAALNADWAADLGSALAFDPPHISLYGLTVEQGAPLARWVARGDTVEASHETYGEDFLAAHDFFTDAGYEHYEVSNFSRAGFRSRHNSAYWSGADYLGVGPSAHAFENGARRWNVRDYSSWLARCHADESPVESSELLTPFQRSLEAAYLGLRTDRGMLLSDGDPEKTARWVDAGWATVLPPVIKLTPEGWLRLDSLAAEIGKPAAADTYISPNGSAVA